MNELHESLAPIVKLVKLFGSFPYNIKSDGKLELSLFQIGYIVILYIVIDYFLYLRFIHINEYGQQGSFLAQSATSIVILLTEIFILITHLLNYINRKFLGKFFIDLWMFDQEVSFMRKNN